MKKQMPIQTKTKNYALFSAVIFGIGFAVCQYLIYFYAPLEQSMGLAQKIFYYHLPVAWWTFAAFFVTFVTSILYLKTKKQIYDHIAVSSTEIGMLFATLALLTGSIWGKNSWNTWWTWDPRLTTTLILWFIYAAYLAIHSMPLTQKRASTISAVLGIVGFLDVPFVFLSARLARSIHPAVFASKSGGLEPEMFTTVIACVIVFFFLYFTLLCIRTEQKKQNAYLEDKALEALYED